MQSLIAFIALPGLVAFAVPALLAATVAVPGVSWFGFVPAILGLAALAWCAVEFHRRGHGTLAPWAPPRRLVTSGLYAHSRNPMYLAVLLILAGWALALRSAPHAAYAASVAVAFHLRVVVGEEPRQVDAFGAEWQAYRAAVPRWLPPLQQWPAWLWFGVGALFGAALWLFSSALLGHAEPWDAQAPVWSLSWPLIGALGAAARHARGLLLPFGYAFGQIAVTVPGMLRSEFGVLSLAFMGGGLVVGLAVAIALLAMLALWRRLQRSLPGGSR